MRIKLLKINDLLSAACALGFFLALALTAHAAPSLVVGGKVVTADRASPCRESLIFVAQPHHALGFQPRNLN